EKIHGEADSEMAQAAKASEGKPNPGVDTLFDQVYAELPAHLSRQREGLRAEGGGHAVDQDAAFPL
ncbi:MAG TPA: hypothetical protein PKA37_13505, partial [Planctomycetota bacterium]|nr:hypothetical protein [Planctomycetota bacterium]